MNKMKTVIVGIDYSDNSERALREASRIANWMDSKLVCLHVIEDEILQEFRGTPTFDESGVLDSALRRLELHVANTVGAGHDIECKAVIGHPFKECLASIDATGADLLVLGSHGLKKDNPRRVGTLASRCIRKAPVDVLLVRQVQDGPFRSILACVDFSENSLRAAYRAADIAVQDNAALELYHVYRSPIYIASEAGGLGPVLPPIDSVQAKAQLKEKLNGLAEKISVYGDNLEVRTEVIEHASVSAAIVERIEENAVDLVVLGTRGRTGMKILLMGTTAEHIIHDAPCSALAVKPEGFGES